MSKISMTSPDGLVQVKEITHKGQLFHLPPWIPEDEFKRGLDSDDASEPLSSLVSCQLAFWGELGPGFQLRFKLPFNSVRELANSRFTPGGLGYSFTEGPLESERVIEILEDGLLFGFCGCEYLDFHNVEVALLPTDFAAHTLPPPHGSISEFWEYLQNHWQEIRVEEHDDDSEVYKEFLHDGQEYFIFANFFED